MAAKLSALVILVILASALAISLWLHWSASDAGGDRGGASGPAPVAVAAIEQGLITARRTFSGSVEAQSTFQVAAKVSGRVAAVLVDVGDTVERSQVVIELDDAEFAEAERSAQADLAVALATRELRDSALKLARRAHNRMQELHEDGLASAAEFDQSRSRIEAAEAELQVAQAQVERAESLRNSARIRRGYTRVQAVWPETQPSGKRLVIRRLVEPGDTVAVNDPLLTVASVDPALAAFAVTESDYTQLAIGQEVVLISDAYPDKRFPAQITRLAPTFDARSRQARVEVTVPNAEAALKPGMFARLQVDLASAEDAITVPARALSKRAGETVIFVLDRSGETPSVRQVAVEPGLREGNRIQVMGAEVSGEVVVLGQQLIEDGSAVRLAPEDEGEAPAGSGP